MTNGPTDNPGRLSLYRKGRTALIWFGTSSILVQIINWLITLLTARLLTPKDYGVLAMAETFTPYLALLASLNMASWITQRSTLAFKEVNAARKLALLLASAVFLVTWFSAPWLSTFYNSTPLLWTLRAIAITFVLRSLSAIPEAVLQRELQMRELSLLQASIAIARGAIQLVLAWLGWGLWALIFGVLFKEFTYTLILLSYIYPKHSSHGVLLNYPGDYIPSSPTEIPNNGEHPQSNDKTDRVIWKEALAFGIPVTASTLLWILYTTADNVVIGKFFGSAKLGIYAISFYLADLPLSKLNSFIRPILVPLLSRLRETSTDFTKQYYQLIRIIGWLALPAIAGLGTASAEIVDLLLGGRWLESVPVIRALAIVCYIRALTDNIPPLFYALGKPGPVFKFNLLCAAILPLAFVILGWRFEFAGIYFCWIIIYGGLSLAIVRSAAVEIRSTVHNYFLNLSKPIVASIFTAAAIYLVKSSLSPNYSSFIVLPIEFLTGLIAVPLCLKLFAPSDFATICQFSSVREKPIAS